MAISYNPGISRDSLLLYVDALRTNPLLYGVTTLTKVGGLADASLGYYTLDGVDDGIQINTSLYNTTYTGKTVILAAKLAEAMTNNTYRGMIGGSSGTIMRNFNLYMNRDVNGFYKLHFSTGNGTSGSGSTSSVIVPEVVGQWNIFGICNHPNNTITYYVNGEALNTTSHPLHQYNSGTTEYLGRSDNLFKGSMAFWQVYGRALSSSEVKQNVDIMRWRYGI